MYVQYDVQIHTYIHTYRQTPVAFNMLMWGSLRLAQACPNELLPIFMACTGADVSPDVISIYILFEPR